MERSKRCSSMCKKNDRFPDKPSVRERLSNRPALFCQERLHGNLASDIRSTLA